MPTELIYNNWLGTFSMSNIGGWLGIGQKPQPEAKDFHNWFWRAINGNGNPLCFIAGLQPAVYDWEWIPWAANPALAGPSEILFGDRGTCDYQKEFLATGDPYLSLVSDRNETWEF